MNEAAVEIYEIRLQGHLSSTWAGRFAGMAVELTPVGETRLTGPVVDQAALYGLLKKARDLGLPLLAVNRLPDEAGARNAQELNKEK